MENIPNMRLIALLLLTRRDAIVVHFYQSHSQRTSETKDLKSVRRTSPRLIYIYTGSCIATRARETTVLLQLLHDWLSVEPRIADRWDAWPKFARHSNVQPARKSGLRKPFRVAESQKASRVAWAVHFYAFKRKRYQESRNTIFFTNDIDCI